ncbi:MAG: tetratricopeptide repeat protein [Alphaproteobacteria bacterium]
MSDQPPRGLLVQAEAGDAEAQNEIGRFHAARMPDAGAAAAAAHWFGRAAEQGLLKALHNLGVLALREGHADLAERVFQTASDRGWTNSTVALGSLREEAGAREEARDLYESAAKQGNADGQDRLAGMALRLDTDHGFRVARYWSELSAAQGSAAGLMCLATIYHEGLAVERDGPRAHAYYLAAARKGHRGAQLMTGVAFETGANVARDLVESTYWLKRAAAQGDGIAVTYLKRVEGRLSGEQARTVAARLADDGVES